MKKNLIDKLANVEEIYQKYKGIENKINITKDVNERVNNLIIKAVSLKEKGKIKETIILYKEAINLISQDIIKFPDTSINTIIYRYIMIITFLIFIPLFIFFYFLNSINIEYISIVALEKVFGIIFLYVFVGLLIYCLFLFFENKDLSNYIIILIYLGGFVLSIFLNLFYFV